MGSSGAVNVKLAGEEVHGVSWCDTLSPSRGKELFAEGSIK